MKFYQKKKSLYPHLFFGVLWLSYGIYRIISTSHFLWVSLGFIFISGFDLILFFYFWKKPVLEIDKQKIVQNNPLKIKTIRLDKIVKIEYFAGDYTIYADGKKILINTLLFDKESAEKLKLILDKLNTKKQISL